jgi:hypothetical protein
MKEFVHFKGLQSERALTPRRVPPVIWLRLCERSLGDVEIEIQTARQCGARARVNFLRCIDGLRESDEAQLVVCVRHA